MFIIFEGPDGSGKSTLAEAVYRKTHATQIHHGPPPLGKALETFSHTILSAATSPAPYVVDRLHWGDYPYGTVHRKSELGIDGIVDLDRWITYIGGLIVYVQASAETVNARIAARGGADSKWEDPEAMTQIVNLYDELFAASQRECNALLRVDNNEFGDTDRIARDIIAEAEMLWNEGNH